MFRTRLLSCAAVILLWASAPLAAQEAPTVNDVIKELSSLSGDGLDIRSPAGAAFVKRFFEGEINVCDAPDLDMSVCAWQADPEQGVDAQLGLAKGRIEVAILYSSEMTSANWTCKKDEFKTQWCVPSAMTAEEQAAALARWAAFMNAAN